MFRRNRSRCCVGRRWCKYPKPVGNGFRTACCAKDGLDSCGGDGREEVLHIHCEDDALTSVGSDECRDGATLDEAMY